eukprot:751170_1
MTPLHFISMNPHAPDDAILALLKANINAASEKDERGNTPLDYALHYNPIAFVRMHHYLRDNGIENGTKSLLVNRHYDNSGNKSTPFHVLAKNPFAPAKTIAALLELKKEAAFRKDDKGNTPLDYAAEYNVDGLISMMNVLCNHRKSMASMVKYKALEN